jgi:hypothetical protein
MADYNDGNPSSLGEGSKVHQCPTHVLIAVGVHLIRQVGHQRVDGHKFRANELNCFFDGVHIVRGDGYLALSFTLPDADKGNLAGLDASGVQTRSNDAGPVVFSGENDSARGARSRATIRH